MIRVTYLYHSGFAVELDRHLLVFDYYRGELPAVPAGKQLIIFASHKHQDHFQLPVLKWGETHSPNASYFLGNDIELNEAYLAKKGLNPELLERTVRMHPGEYFELPEKLRVEALHSTDTGVAFLVQVEGISIYHAGDLNHWYWKEETKSWNDRMEQDYHAEIDRIAGRHFHLAFVPLDPRLSDGYHLGLDYFLEKTEADHIFPMHMWEDYQIIQSYKKTPFGRRFAGKIEDVSEKKKEFMINSDSLHSGNEK